MRTRRSSWLLGALTVVAVFGTVGYAVAPAFAASPLRHSVHSPAHKTYANFKQQNCKTRNKASGTIKWSDWQFPDTLNVYQTSASVSQETIDSLVEGLITFDQNGNVQPDLLAGLPKSDKSGKTWTAKLKKGAHWSDGREITAADVVFGWKIGMNKNSGPLCSGSCDAISRIDTKGKYGLTFHLKRVYAAFVSSGLPPVWPTSWKGAWTKGDVAGAVAKLFQDPSFNFENATFPTNGAYQVKEFVNNDRIVLTPMKYYTTLSCGAKLAQLIFAFYSSKPALIAAAASHSTDSTTDYTLADISELNKHTSAFHVHNDPGFLIEGLWLNNDPQYNGAPNPLHDTKVRLALALALDKYGLIQSALGMSRTQASGVIAWSPLIITKALVQPFADKALKGQYDPVTKKYTVDTGRGKALADAKTLLSQTSFKAGFSLDGVTTTGNPVRQAQFAVVQASWAKINVKFNPTFIPASKLFSDWDHGSPLKHGAFQVAQFASVGYPDPDGFKYSFQHQYIERERTVHPCPVCGNDMAIHDSIIDKAFDKAAGTTSKAARQKWYNVFQVQLNKMSYIIPLFYRGSINTDDGHIANYASNPTNLGEEWNTFNWSLKR